ncbi:hypothetical protein DPMN_191181 [Dreissena polymorpha]|uniref:Uncharacterized protein n=1 Tax=Dreissena polymorpha TaxID=45954 RepID=A0A9D4BCC7_DREPO|nr:hypothetical protein DPMN_191181 [Dreissena polymorpha]
MSDWSARCRALYHYKHLLFIVESSPARTCQRSRLKRAGDGGTARPPVWGTYGTDLGRHTPRTSRGWL